MNSFRKVSLKLYKIRLLYLEIRQYNKGVGNGEEKRKSYSSI